MIEARTETVEFCSYAEEFMFKAESGRGWKLSVSIPAKKILEVCEVLRRFPEGMWGHAFWHWTHKDRPIPCDTPDCRIGVEMVESGRNF